MVAKCYNQPMNEEFNLTKIEICLTLLNALKFVTENTILHYTIIMSPPLYDPMYLVPGPPDSYQG